MSSRISRWNNYLLRSGLIWVVAGFSVLVVINLISLALDPDQLLSELRGNPLGPFASVFVFDSWGTTGGLGGVVILFTPLLFGIQIKQRLRASLFFLTASVIIGVAANVVWTFFYDDTGFIGSGSSSIAFAAQAIIFGLSITGLISLAQSSSNDQDRGVRALREFFLVVYVTLILSTLYFVLVLQPIFTPTLLYNWRVHEIAFLTGAAAAILYGVALNTPTTNLVPPAPAR